MSNANSMVLPGTYKLKDGDNANAFYDIHPGPFSPVGGSDIPHQIYKTMNSSAMVLHSVSDHSLNLPSQQDV